MTAKKGKKKINLPDLKPKKDAKGGVIAGPSHSLGSHSPSSHGPGPHVHNGP